MRHMVFIFGVRIPFPFFYRITFIDLSNPMVHILLYRGYGKRMHKNLKRKGNCEHALSSPKCSPCMLVDMHSFIFYHSSWDIFVGAMACGGSIILRALPRFLR